MIEYLGNLFHSDAPAIGHGVNTKGLMGVGIALEFAGKFPDMFMMYHTLCQNGTLHPGDTMIYEEPKTGLLIYNLATQEFPGKSATLPLVAEAATNAADHADENGIDRIALPRIGCGIGGLNWLEVHDILLNIEMMHEVEFEVWIK